MRIKLYLKDKGVFLFIHALISLIISATLFVYQVSSGVILLLWLISFVPLVLWFSIDFFRKKSYYNSLMKTMESLDEKYLLCSVIEEGNFVESVILCDILFELSKSMSEQVNSWKSESLEYREFIESWVHEIKTPVAALGLTLQNKGTASDATSELDRIERYIEQVLYYARSESAEKDFFIKKIILKDVVGDVLKKYTKHFVYQKISLELSNLDIEVFADPKWLGFIIDQLINNALKYRDKTDPKLSISATVNKNNKVLSIKDNGVRIAEKDVERIFKKGFTGENGRIFGKSTGMGLYICKKLCDKLHIGIEVSSVLDEGTEFSIIFPENTMMPYRENY